MAFDKKAYQKKYAAQWYKDNKEITLKRSRKSTKVNRERNQNFVRQLKEDNPCIDCRRKVSSLRDGF